MPYQNINDLPAAEIRFDENGDIKDIDVAVLKDNVLNFTKFSNLPIYNKYQIDTKIRDFEETMTAKLQEQNMIGSIFVENENKELVQGNLKLSEIAEKLKKYSCMEIGTRYNISTSTGTVTTHQGKRVVKKGNRIYIEDIDPEATGLDIGVGRMNSDYETEIMVENKFALNIYPWCEMKKMQISLDDTDFNYDLSTDNGGNYFTEVPLYYVKEQYLLEQETQVSINGATRIIYNPVYDLTSIWDTLDPVSVIPQRFIDDTENVYSIGMYKWVSKYPMNGYRPAEFFVKKVKAVPTIDDGSYASSVKRYVKIKLNDREFYQLYDSFMESDIFSYNAVTRYVLINSDVSEYVDVLTSKHYFSCYEAKIEYYNSTPVMISRPDKFPTVSTSLVTFRSRSKNLGNDYYVRDMRSYTDFYGFLMDIEYKTLHSQSIMNGATNMPYSNSNIVYFNQSNTNKIILPYTQIASYVKGQTVICGTTYGNSSGFSNGIIVEEPKALLLDRDFTIEKNENDEYIQYYYTGIDPASQARMYGIDELMSDDGKIYYRIIIPTVSDDVYVTVSEDGTDIASSLPSGTAKEDALYYYNGYLYASMSGSISSKMLYSYTIDKIAPSILSTYMCHTMSWKTGTTDILTQRTGAYSTSPSTDTKHPFKWNWIENPYANIWKFLDGIHITHNAVPDVSAVHNAIYFCDNPELYSDSYTNYELLTSYYSPGNEGYVTRIGFDPKYPWVQITSKSSGGSSTNYYADYYYQNSVAGSTGTRCVFAGGSWVNGSNAGLRFFLVSFGLTFSFVYLGAAFERQGE